MFITDFFTYVNSLIQPCLTDECADDEEMVVREINDDKNDDWNLPSQHLVWGRLFGLTTSQALLYKEYQEAITGFIDFITDMLYFASVYHIKVSDNNHSGNIMKAIFFSVSIFGFVMTLYSTWKITKHKGGHITDLNVDETVFNAALFYYLRCVIEDIPTCYISVQIEEYRGYGYFFVVSICASLLAIMNALNNFLNALRKKYSFTRAQDLYKRLGIGLGLWIAVGSPFFAITILMGLKSWM